MVDVCTSDGDRCRVHERRVLELGLAVGTQIEDDTRTVLEPVRPGRRRRAADAAPDRPSRAIASRAARTSADARPRQRRGTRDGGAPPACGLGRRPGAGRQRRGAHQGSRSRPPPGRARPAAPAGRSRVVRRGAGRAARPGAGTGTRCGGQTVWDDSDRTGAIWPERPRSFAAAATTPTRWRPYSDSTSTEHATLGPATTRLHPDRVGGYHGS